MCKLQLSASMPLASVLRRCISYSSKSLDVGDVATDPCCVPLLLRAPVAEPMPAEPAAMGGGGGGSGLLPSMSELPLLELGVVA